MATDFIVDEELTEFAFTADNLCFAGDNTTVPVDTYDTRGGFAGPQEWEFRKQRLSDLSSETVTGLPLLTHTPGAWVALTEADLSTGRDVAKARAPWRLGPRQSRSARASRRALTARGWSRGSSRMCRPGG